MFQFDEPFGSTIFCDDVRNEIGGKNSYIGVYTGMMVLQSFPATISKIGIVTTIFEPRSMAEVRDWDIVLHVYLPGDEPDKPSAIGNLPPVPKEAYHLVDSSAVPDDPEVPKLIIASAAFTISPVIFREPGRIKVRAIYKEGMIIKLGSIRIQPPSQIDVSQVPAST